MKKVTIEARDKNKVLLGSVEVDKPETMSELLETFDEAQIQRFTWAGYVIEEQRLLRGGKAEPSPVKEFKKLTPEQQNEILRRFMEKDKPTNS